jgi:hypothetical protein
VSVYVDDMQAPYGRMKMCHMLADTTEELLAMADRIGVDHKWIQDAGTAREHFDIALSKRALAITAGAKLVGPRELALVMRRKNQASLPSPPSGAEEK